MSRSLPPVIEIGDRRVGRGCKPLVIAEVAQAHDGSLGAAHAFIDVAAECGADAIKFQTHIADAESTLDEQFRVRFSFEDETRYGYWQRMEFTAEQWAGLARHAREKGLLFLSSAFSLEAVELLRKLDMPAWKVASGEIRNTELLDAMADTGQPLLLSSGMSSLDDLDEAMDYLGGKVSRLQLGIFQCTTRYPTPYEEVGLNVLEEMKARYGVPVGLSDHSGNSLPSIAAMTLGASMVEVHIAFHEGQFGPDTVASLTPSKLLEVCEARDAIHAMLSNPVDKSEMARQLSPVSRLFGRSLALKRDQPAGTVIAKEMLTLKKPGSGMPHDAAGSLLGRRLKHDKQANRLLHEDDFED